MCNVMRKVCEKGCARLHERKKRKGKGKVGQRDWQRKRREREKSVKQRDVVGKSESTCSKVRV